MSNFITSDTHFWHSNILKYPSCMEFRGGLYGDVEAMNDSLVDSWNKTVGEDDTVYHLGDFVLSYGKNLDPRIRNILDRLNGKIILIRGNHDNHITREAFSDYGHTVLDYKEVNFEKNKIVMSHYPFATWNKSHHGSVMLHGHSHGSYQAPGGRILDVGWDVHGRLLRLEEAYEIAMKKPIYSVDHHKPE